MAPGAFAGAAPPKCALMPRVARSQRIQSAAAAGAVRALITAGLIEEAAAHEAVTALIAAGVIVAAAGQAAADADGDTPLLQAEPSDLVELVAAEAMPRMGGAQGGSASWEKQSWSRGLGHRPPRAASTTKARISAS
jgi:hypothetical protein